MPLDSLPARVAPRLVLEGALALALLALLACFAAPAAAGAPPVAIINAPNNNATYFAGDLIVFKGNDSFDPEGSPLYFIWDFPTETFQGAGLQVVNYTNFTTPGNYSVRLTVRDNESLESNASVTVKIRPANLPPTAVVEGPANGSRFFTNEFIPFSATGSFDPEGSPLTFSWSENPTGQFGTGENLSVRLPAGNHTVTLHAFDNLGAEGTADVRFTVEVDMPPRVTADSVAPASGFEGDLFAFTATYTEDNGQPSAGVLLVLDGGPHPMQLAAGGDPRAGQTYAVALALLAGRHAYYALASDGNLTNLSLTQTGPDVWLNISVLSSDGLAKLTLRVIPPYALTVSLWPGALPPDPQGLSPVSAAYTVNGTALDASNFTLAVSFTPGAQVIASSALVHRADGGAWLSLVTAVEQAGNSAAVNGSPLELPALFRVFARRASGPSNVPPTPVITVAGDFYPNSTVAFDAGQSNDSENATLLFDWRFKGPGFETGWLPGRTVHLAFPAAGLYNISLRVDDGSGNIVTKDITLEVRDRPLPVSNPWEEPTALAGLAAAVLLSAALAVWWRGRRPKRRKTYEDLYGRLYGARMAEETEYTRLFEKYAEADGARGPSEAPGVDPPAKR